MSSARWRRRREEGRNPRRRTESLGAERHHRGHERQLMRGLASSAASRKRPSSLLGVYSSRLYVLTWLVGVMGMGRGRVSAQQYDDGGKVLMDCEEACYCKGSSDDGTIEVFQSPSSGELVSDRGCTGVRERGSCCSCKLYRDVEILTVEILTVYFTCSSYDACLLSSVPGNKQRGQALSLRL